MTTGICYIISASRSVNGPMRHMNFRDQFRCSGDNYGETLFRVSVQVVPKNVGRRILRKD
jgi:hypothetical protein